MRLVLTEQIFWALMMSAALTLNAVSFWSLRRSRRNLRQSDELLDKIKAGNANPGGQAETVILKWAPAASGTMALLGFPIQIRETAIGQPFRLLVEGQPERGFDDRDAAIDAAQRAAVALHISQTIGDLMDKRHG